MYRQKFVRSNTKEQNTVDYIDVTGGGVVEVGVVCLGKFLLLFTFTSIKVVLKSSRKTCESIVREIETGFRKERK